MEVNESLSFRHPIFILSVLYEGLYRQKSVSLTCLYLTLCSSCSFLTSSHSLSQAAVFLCHLPPSVWNVIWKSGKKDTAKMNTGINTFTWKHFLFKNKARKCMNLCHKNLYHWILQRICISQLHQEFMPISIGLVLQKLQQGSGTASFYFYIIAIKKVQ